MYSRQCLTIVSYSSKFVKNTPTPLGVVFSFLFSVLRNVVKNSVSCLIHYIDISVTLSNKNLHRHRKKYKSLKACEKKTRVFYDQIRIGKLLNSTH